MASSSTVTMDHIKSFFSLDAELQPLDIAPTVTGGLGINNIEQYPPPEVQHMKCRKGAEYARKYIREEQEMERQVQRTPALEPLLSAPAGGLESLEELSTAVGDISNVNELDGEIAQELYATYYKQNVQYNPDLPITNYREKILQLININQVVVIQGATGCGKTTQVPQYILDYYAGIGHQCNILVTQPRRIAAVSIARRVCQERNWQLGTIVGYQVAMDNKISVDTRISYVTTGVFLQKLVNSRRMDMYTHVIVDEIHERDQDTDFALLVVKKLLRSNSKQVKVILMSATIDTSLFAKYFSFPGGGDPAPIVEIHGKTKEVTEHYLQELSALGIEVPILDPDVPSIPDASYDLVVKLMLVFDKIEKAEQNVESDKVYAPVRGAVLIFLPGYEEISSLSNKLRAAAVSRKYTILPLHSSITIEEQTRVFKRPNIGFRKVIISTNIAESSITVPDIKYVIDFCLTRSLMCDGDTNYTCLQLQWATKSNCVQRKGRAGRVDIGRVYRMVPREFYESLPQYAVPEMKRCPLEQTVLYTKKLNFGEPQALLALALDPPALSDIENSILVLKEVGALAITINGVVCPYDGDLTFIGQVMAVLPLDVKISKLIIYGYVFDCLEDCIIIAACLSLKSFFSRPFQRLLDSFKSKLAWANGTFSDCLSYLNAYRMWKELSAQGQFKRPGGCREDTWAHQNFIQLPRIREVDLLVQELKRRLESVNIKVNYHRHKDDLSVDMLILKMVIAAAFYPNFFIQTDLDEKEVTKQISNADPFTTVVVSGLPANHGVLYYSALRDMLSCCSPRMTIEFEERKAYIQFHRRVFEQNSESTSDANSILPAVYFAVKMRQMRVPLELQVFSHEEAESKIEQYRLLQEQDSGQLRKLSSKRMTVQPISCKLKQVELPAINQLVIQIFITHVTSCGHFWARYVDQRTTNVMKFLEDTINTHNGENLLPIKGKLQHGMLVLAPYSEKNTAVLYYRATIEDILDDDVIVVFYVDYGNTTCVRRCDLRHIDVANFPDLGDIPALAFECQLSEVKPSAIKSSNFGWSHEAKSWFQKMINGKILHARLYSVVQNVVRLSLVTQDQSGSDIVIKDELIRLGYAEPAEESYASKLYYGTKMKCEELALSLPMEHDSTALNITPELLQLQDVRKTPHKIRLRGPFSPLEVAYAGTTYLDHTKVIRIDQDSVNSVSLDPEPQDKHSQLLVGCSIAVSQRGDVLKVRSTTLMPKVTGLQGLLCLLFAPCAELRCDPERKAYTGALCGLGYDPVTGSSLYHDHDIEVVFETDIDYQDICDINAIRMGVNIAFGNEEEMATWSEQSLQKIQGKLRTGLLNLVKRKRQPREPRNFSRSYSWMQVPSEHVLLPQYQETVGEHPQILPAHRAINLCEDRSLKNEMKEHLKELHDKAGRSLAYEQIRCLFCGVMLYNQRALLLHMLTVEHTEKVENFLK